MEDRLDRIRKERKLKGLKWSDLAEGLPVSGEAIRVAFYRNAVDEVYLSEIEKRLGITPDRSESTESTEEKGDVQGSEKEYRVEDLLKEITVDDLIAQKVVEKLRPFLRAKTDEILQAIMNLHLELNKVRNKQEATLRKAEETFTKADDTFKKAEDTYEKVKIIEERH